jgi:ABC-type multidrug transport system ATPase subunit
MHTWTLCYLTLQQIFALFDRLLVLAQGRTVYFGPASSAYSHFSKLQKQISSTTQFTAPTNNSANNTTNNKNTKNNSTIAAVIDKGNPADYVMSVVAAAQSSTTSATQPCLTVDMLAQACVDTVHWSELQRKGDNLSATVHYSVRTKQRKYARTLYAQSYILTQRHLLKVFKNKRFVGTCKYLCDTASTHSISLFVSEILAVAPALC